MLDSIEIYLKQFLINIFHKVHLRKQLLSNKYF